MNIIIKKFSMVILYPIPDVYIQTIGEFNISKRIYKFKKTK